MELYAIHQGVLPCNKLNSDSQNIPMKKSNQYTQNKYWIEEQIQQV